MATKKIKLPKDNQGNEYYPATTTDAVVHPVKRKSMTAIIDESEKKADEHGNAINEINETLPNKVDRTDNAPELTSGFAGNLVGRGESTSEEIGFRPSGGLTSVNDGAARIERLKGNTLVWNQLRDNIDGMASNGVSYSEDNKGVITASGVLTSSYASISKNISAKGRIGHKLLLIDEHTGNTDAQIRVSEGAFSLPIGTLIDTSRGVFNLYFYGEVGQEISFSKKIFIYDLTQMFGAGNEPSTLEEFESMRPVGVTDDYNVGELVSVTADTLKTVGFNAWDEEWELGSFNSEGNPISSAGCIRTKNSIRILPNTSYYLKSKNKWLVVFFFDDQGNLIKSAEYRDTAVITPPNAHYMKFRTDSSYGNTYNHDICINLSHTGYRNGEYEPYETYERPLPISDIKDSEGNQLFPYGLLKAGEVYDEITEKKAIKRIGVVDMGSLTWSDAYIQYNYGYTAVAPESMKTENLNYAVSVGYEKYTNPSVEVWRVLDKAISNGIRPIGPSWVRYLAVKDSSHDDLSSFKAAISGVMLYYELATPIEVDLEEPIALDYEVSDFGTEQILSSRPSALLKADIIYQFNAVDRIRENSSHIGSLTERTTQLDNGKADKEGYLPKLTSGFSDNLVGRGEATDETISFRASGGSTSIEDGAARVERLKGNTLVWNQWVKNGDFANSDNWVGRNGTLSVANAVATYTLSEIAEQQYNNHIIQQGVHVVKGHKYLLSINIKSSTGSVGLGGDIFSETGFSLDKAYISSPNTWTNYSGIGTYSSDYAPSNLYVYLYGDKSIGDTISLSKVRVYDLTQMFGAGNEPTTIEEFNAMKPIGIDEYAYNEGELISTTADEIKSVGFNAWDEEWEIGIYSNANGIKHAMNERIRCKNYIPCLPNTSYYYAYSVSGGYLRICYYDTNKNFISALNDVYWNSAYTTPVGAYYLTFCVTGYTITTYNHDICIHLVHTGYRNGEYEPYEEFRRSLPISEIKDSEGNALFPNGLLSAGSAYDEITATKAIKRIGVVDMGTLKYAYGNSGTWNANRFFAELPDAKPKYNYSCVSPIYIKGSLTSGGDKTIHTEANRYVYIRDESYTDPATFKAAMSGVMLYYELAEPIEVDLEEPINLDYEVSDFGTEEVISDTPTTPLKADIIYQFNAVDRIRENSLSLEDLIKRVAALEAQNAALVQQLNATDNGETE